MSGLKIALDATPSAGADLSGVGVYSRELMRELARLYAAEAEWIWAYRSQRWRAAWFGGPTPPSGVRRRPMFESWTPRADLFHGLGQRLPAVFDRLPRRARTVVTFHDLFVMTSDRYSTPEFRARFTAQAHEAARRADAIIAVSRFTAGQVESLLGVEPARIHVVHHGVRPLAVPPGIARQPLILSVGALQVRKNTLGLLRAFERLPGPVASGWKLVLAGSRGGGFGAEELLREIERSPRRASIELPGWVDDAELGRLYARASIFAFPSLDEGFGIPVLEAMAAGLPVLASNSSSLPEVCGNAAAVLVEPGDVDAMAAGLARLIESASLRDELSARGRAHSAAFTWERCAQETWCVYRGSHSGIGLQ